GAKEKECNGVNVTRANDSRTTDNLPLPSIEAVSTLPASALPPLLLQLAALVAAAGARVATPLPAPTVAQAEPDQLLDVMETAKLIGYSISWVRKHGHTLPGFCQPGGKG